MRIRTVVLLISSAALSLFGAIGAHAQLIHTVAGGNPNNVSANSVGIIPAGLAADVFGNLYIVGTDENSIFKVDSSGVLTTVVGNGASPYSGGPGPASGYSGDGGTATSASLNTPNGVALDAAGNIYIADGGNNVIRFVNVGNNPITIAGVTVQPGNIATVAGNGTSGYSGDGGPATSASFNKLIGLALDAAGNIYIPDSNNNLIRVVNTGTSPITVAGVTVQAGNIATVAGNGSRGYSGDGGLATGASLNSPNSVAVDSGGNIYILDGGLNEVVRVVNVGMSPITVAGITIQPGNIATVVGIAGCHGRCSSGDGGPAIDARLMPEKGLAVDSAGNIYIATTVSSGSGVRVVNTGISVVTIAGVTIQPGDIATVVGGGTGPNTGLALNASFQGGGGFQGISGGLALDSAGNLYLGDQSSRVVWVVNAGINIATIAGATIQPASVAAVAGNGTQEFSGDGELATNAQLFYPQGVKLDSGGNIYFVDAANNVIRAVNEAVTPITIAGVTIQPGNIATIVGTNSPSEGIGDGGPALNATLNQATDIALDASGNLYIADQYSGRIRVVNVGTSPIMIAGVTIQPGDIATVAGTGIVGTSGGYGGDGGPATSAALCNPVGVALDSAGNIFIADSCNARIRAVNAGTNPETIAGITIQPGNIATVAGNGTWAYSGDGGPATSAEINAPMDVALDSGGNLYIADTWNDVVRVVNTGTSIVTVAGIGIQPGNIATIAGNNTSGYSGDGGLATNAQFINISGLNLDANNNLYVVDSSNSVIRVVNTIGIIDTVAGNGTFGYTGDGGSAASAELNVPIDVALDGAGNMYVTDMFNERIRKVDALPSAVIAPQIINFGNQSIGVPSPPLTTTLSNPGGAPLLFSIGFNGSNSNDFNETADTCSTLAGQLAPGSSCTVSIVFKASAQGGESANLLIADNSTGIPNSLQSVTLSGTGNLSQASVITSTTSASFTVGAVGSFTVTTTGYPTPALAEAGALPSGVTFNDNHDGTGTLNGTASAVGTFNIQLTASNGVGSNAVQSFTLTVSLPTVASVTLNPTSVPGGITNSTGTVTLNAPAFGTAVQRRVTLSSDNTSAATVPLTVNVVAGATSANFTVTSLTVAATSTANISGSLNGGTQSAPLNVTPPAGVISLVLNPTTVVGGSVNPTATVTLNAPAAGTIAERKVTLSSDTPTAASVPTSVTVPVGATTATFTVNSNVVNAVANPVITATLNGSVTATLIVNPVVAAFVILNPASVPGGLTNATGTVTLNVPAVGTVAQRTVILSSDTPTAATVPATVVVAAGATSANFTVTSLLVATTTTVNFSATLNGGTQSATLTVTPPPAVLSLTLNPTAVVGGSSNATATVTLNAPAAGTAAQRKVTLSSSSTAVATVPASVVVAVGATSASFTVTSKVVNAVANPVITANLNGSVTATLAVNPVVVVSLTLNPTGVQGGIADSTGMVTLNVPAVGTVAQRTVTLSSDNTSAATVPATVVVAAGALSVNFTVTSHAVGLTKTATISGSINGITQNGMLTVTP